MTLRNGCTVQRLQRTIEHPFGANIRSVEQPAIEQPFGANRRSIGAAWVEQVYDGAGGKKKKCGPPHPAWNVGPWREPGVTRVRESTRVEQKRFFYPPPR